MENKHFDNYENKSIDYVSGEIAHTERSARQFRLEGNLAEAEDRDNHAKKLWEIYHKKKSTKTNNMENQMKYGVFRNAKNKLASINTFVNEEQAIYLKDRLMEQRTFKSIVKLKLSYIVKPIKVLKNGN